MGLNLPKKAKIVIKIGSSIITSKSGKIDKRRLQTLAIQIAELKSLGFGIVLVSSGAIACGMQKLNYKQRPKTIGECCCVAAVGQTLLMTDYEQVFRRYRYLTAQILLTSDGLEERGRYLNARNTIMDLLKRGDIIPIVNENDAVATEEIRFGDNDKLSAQVAALIDADLLLILSDVDGLYDRQGKIVDRVEKIDANIVKICTGTKKDTSVGGMVTKIEAAKIATGAGIPVLIANGNRKDIMQRAIGGARCGTFFVPAKGKISAKKRWIAFSCKDCGRIIVDDGAKEAVMRQGRSLLAIGIVCAEGGFSFGDLVIILDKNNKEIARGLTNYSQDEIRKIKGIKTNLITEVLGYKSYDEVVHRDNMVIIK
ncbi:MAG: glutamate 5-kinase [Candidatus Omnitrophota bacterium]